MFLRNPSKCRNVLRIGALLCALSWCAPRTLQELPAVEFFEYSALDLCLKTTISDQPAFFPHSMARYLINLDIVHLAVRFGGQKNTARIVFVPIDFGAWFYIELLARVTSEGLVQLSGSYEKNVVVKQAAANDIFCEWFAKNGECFPQDARKKYVIFWGYVMYNVNMDCVPRHITILSLENIGSLGVQDVGAVYDNGCYDRCLVMPYLTEHSIKGHVHYINKHAGLSASPWLFREPFEYNEIENGHVHSREYLVSFAGSFNRTSTIRRYREAWKKACSLLGERARCLSEDGLHLQSSIAYLSVYRQSTFCLILRGDTVTRKAFYESILEGCIPVVSDTDMSVYEDIYHGLFRNLVRAAVVTFSAQLTEPEDLVNVIERASKRAELSRRLRACSRLAAQITYDPRNNPKRNVSVAVQNMLRAIVVRDRAARNTYPHLLS